MAEEEFGHEVLAKLIVDMAKEETPPPSHCLIVVVYQTPDDPMSLKFTFSTRGSAGGAATTSTTTTTRSRRSIVVESVPPSPPPPPLQEEEVDDDFGYVFEPFEIELPVATTSTTTTATTATSNPNSGSMLTTDVIDDLVQIILGRWDFRSHHGLDGRGFPGWSFLLCQITSDNNNNNNNNNISTLEEDDVEVGARRRGDGGGRGLNNNNNNDNNNITPLLFQNVRPICTWNLPLDTFADFDDEHEQIIHRKLVRKLMQLLKLLGNIQTKKTKS